MKARLVFVPVYPPREGADAAGRLGRVELFRLTHVSLQGRTVSNSQKE